MTNKEKFLIALKSDKGKTDEITLGKSIGLDENTTQRIINQLLSEYKITFEQNKNSNYKPFKKN